MRIEAVPRVTVLPRVPRVAILFIVAAVQVGGTFGAARDQPDARDLDALAVGLLLLGPLAIAALRRRPVLALWAAIGCSLAYVAIGYPDGPFVLTPLIAFVGAVVLGHRRAAWTAGVIGVIGAMIAHAFAATRGGVGWGELLGVTTWVVIVLVGGEIIRNNRERRVQAAVGAAELARRRASEERLRIAQDLHDVLAHDISLINVQAGVGLHLMDSRPEQAREALTTIKYASKDALVELRAALDLLRNGDAAPRAPTGGLDQVDGLVSRLRSPQLDVRIERCGTPRALPAGVDLAGFRIVQEALTNVVRHALGATRATVRIEYADDELIVQVDDDGRADGLTTDPDGSGIPGMRTRAGALSGELDASARPGGGFRVRARFPLGRAPELAPTALDA